jgi:hypothetical protein
MGRMGNRPIAMRYGRPQIASMMARNVVVETGMQMPGYLSYLRRAARAGYRSEKARAYGSVWDITHAKQHQLRSLWRPGWNF